MSQDIEEKFKSFARANPGVGDLLLGQNPGIEYPLFRHYRYFAPRSIGDPFVRPVQVQPPTGPKETSSPTATPIASPTVSPTATSERPTGAPSKITESPTVTPTVSSSQPTVSNSTAPTGIIQPFDCVTDDAGRFMTTADSDPARVYFVNYKYSVLTDPFFSEDIAGEVLPFLEKAVLNSILPDIFGSFCNDRRVLQTKLRNRSRRLAITGASTFPADVVSINDSCISENTDYKCNVIEGKMSIYSDGGEEDSINYISELTCAAMDGFDDPTEIHPALLGAKCVRGETIGGVGGGGDNSIGGSGAPNIERAAGDLNPTYLAAALSAFTVVFGVYAYRRRVKKRDDSQNPEHLDDSDVNASASTHAVCVDGDEEPLNIRKPKTTQPAFDLNSIIPPRGYRPETVEESAEEYIDEEFSEVSLAQLNMLSADDSNLS